MNRRFATLLMLSFCALAHADDWPQWLGPQRDDVWRETGILEKFPASGPVIRWRTPISAGYSGPAVANGKVFIHDRILRRGESSPKDPFARGSLPGVERIVCLSESTGQPLWTREYPCAYTVSYSAGPRATPTVDGDRVYTLGAEGDLLCLNIADGAVVWHNKLSSEKYPTPLWGFSASPLIDGDKIITLTPGPGIVTAFDKKTGAELWHALSAKEPGYVPPVIYEAGGKRQLIIWHPESLNSLNPDTGQLYWSEPFESKMGLCVAMPQKSGDLLFVSCFYNGAMVMKLSANSPTATRLWKRSGKNEQKTDGLQTIMVTPEFIDDHIYGVCSYGQLRCLDAKTGDRLWETFAATSGEAGPVRWANAFLTRNGDRTFLANEHGDLIIATLSPKGYEEISRAHLLEPTNRDAGRMVLWSHPAYANKNIYWRNDKEIVCASLAADAVK